MGRREEGRNMAVDRMHLSDQALDLVAMRFRSLGEPMRLKIVRLLEQSELSVGELVQRLKSSQANVSKHLKVLMNAGVLCRRVQGTSAFYSICDPLIIKICDTICSGTARNLKAQAEGFGLQVKTPRNR